MLFWGFLTEAIVPKMQCRHVPSAGPACHDIQHCEDRDYNVRDNASDVLSYSINFETPASSELQGYQASCSLLLYYTVLLYCKNMLYDIL